MSKTLTGGCLCGETTFSVIDDFQMFFFCHCEQCRKLTGSAHAANLFTRPENIKWHSRKESITRFEYPDRDFVKVFCNQCGSSLPFITKNGRFLIVPAGSLNQESEKLPDAQIFCEEQTNWHKAGISASQTDGFPKR